MNRVDFISVRESDAGILGRLRQKAWSATYRGIYPDEMIDQFDYPWHKERDTLRIRSPQYENYFIQVCGQNVGYLTLKKDKVLILYSLYLLPEAQGQGIGRQAFSFVSRYCDKCDSHGFCCHCQPDNTNAMGFYRHMGGRIIARDEENEQRWQNTVVFYFE